MAFDNFTIVCWPLICAAIDMYEPHLTWSPTPKRRHYQCCRDLSKCEEERQKIVLDTRNKYVYCRSPWNRSTQNTFFIFRQCDLSSFQSIRDFVTQFNKQVVIFSNSSVFQRLRCNHVSRKKSAMYWSTMQELWNVGRCIHRSSFLCFICIKFSIVIL